MRCIFLCLDDFSSFFRLHFFLVNTVATAKEKKQITINSYYILSLENLPCLTSREKLLGSVRPWLNCIPKEKI